MLYNSGNISRRRNIGRKERVSGNVIFRTLGPTDIDRKISPDHAGDVMHPSRFARQIDKGPRTKPGREICNDGALQDVYPCTRHTAL